MTKKVDFKKISAHDTPSQSPGFMLWQVSTTWRRAVESTLSQIGLTHPQFVVLATLGWLTRHGDLVSQKEVGQLANLDPNTMSQILKGLETRDLIERIVSSDSRAKNPLLTAKGRKILTEALPAVEKADDEFFTLLEKGEIKSLIGLFEKLM